MKIVAVIMLEPVKKAGSRRGAAAYEYRLSDQNVKSIQLDEKDWVWITFEPRPKRNTESWPPHLIKRIEWD